MKTYFSSGLIFLILSSGSAFGQSIIQNYDVIHNENIVGNAVVKKVGSDQNFMITLNFSAEINFLFKKVMLTGKEYAHFEKRVLKYGSVLRKVDDKIKTNKSIKLSGSSYTAHDGTQSRPLLIREIRDNMLSLFFYEPVKATRMYADNQQKLVDIKEVSPHTYMIPGKDESSNTYIYENGQCSSVILKGNRINLTLKRK